MHLTGLKDLLYLLYQEGVLSLESLDRVCAAMDDWVGRRNDVSHTEIAEVLKAFRAR